MSNEDKWVKEMNTLLKGRSIVLVRIMSEDEMESMGWYARSVVIQLDDNTILYPSQDDEGNGPGSLFTNSEETPILPVFG